jgi:hypothetical protein
LADSRKQIYGEAFAIYGLSEYASALHEQGVRIPYSPPLGINANPKPIIFGEVFAFTFYLG